MSFTAEMYGETNYPKANFVPPEGNMEARIMVIGQAPGKDENKAGRPFVGPAGKMLDGLMKQAGLERSDVWLTNVMKRYPPGDKVNTPAAQREIEQSIPGLHKEIHRLKPKVIVPLGNIALRALGFNHTIGAVRGFVMPTDLGKIIPSYHPAFIFRQYHEKLTCQRDWQKIARHVKHAGMPHFYEDFELNPTIEDVELFLHLIECKVEAGQDVSIALDLETFYIDKSALETPIKLVGMAITDSKAMVIPFIDQQGHYYWKTKDEQLRAIAAIGRILANPNIELVVQHALFDILVLMNHGFDVKCRIYDIMIAHAMVYHLAQHDLGYLASIYTDFPPWKLEKTQTDAQFRYYNARDCTVMKYIRPGLDEDVRSNRVHFLVDMLMDTIILTCRMMLNGIAVDTNARDEVKVLLEAAIADTTEQLCEISGDPAFNPNSSTQVADLLFRKLKLKSQVKTKKSKKLSVAENVLNRLSLRYPKCEAVDILLNHGKLAHRYENFVRDLYIHPDGRVHSSFKLHRVVTGRYASSEPNIMNLPKRSDPDGYIRGMYRVSEGRILVSGDYSQLELMIFAELAHDEIWLDAFRRGIDVHELNGDALLGKYDPKYRTFIKNFIYGLIFGSEGSEVEKVAPKELIQRISIRELMENLKGVHPALFTFRDEIERSIWEKRYVIDAYGRKRWFVGRTLSKADLRAGYNHPIQGTAAGIMHSKSPKLDAVLEPKIDLLVLQLHDAFYIETDERRRDVVARNLKLIMEERVETPMGHTFNLTADITYGKSLAEKDLIAWK